MMFSVILSFIATHILYFALHLESSSFPKPLSAREEIEAFAAFKAGDMAARDKLIQHNLRVGFALELDDNAHALAVRFIVQV